MTTMQSLPRLAMLAAGLLIGAAGCADRATAPDLSEAEREIREPDTPAPAFATLLTCTVDIAAGGALDCEPDASAAAAPGGSNATAAGPDLNLVIGSQHQFVRMANDPPTMEADTWSADVTVQNLTLQPMATLDGTTPEAEGVRVFFVDEPSNGVTIVNHDGEDVFTGSAPQKYFAYAGTAGLGTDEILTPGEESEPRTWEFDLDGATAFTFSVLVWSEVPDPDPAAYSVHFERIAAGGLHTCAEATDGRIYCWGSNTTGQLGNGETGAPGWVPVAVNAPAGVTLSAVTLGISHACADGSDDKVYCWGWNLYGQLGNGASGSGADEASPVAVDAPPGVTLAGVAAGDEHTCAIGSDHKVYCWGHNDFGQLGNGASGTGADEASPVAVEVPAGDTLSGLALGGKHTCAVGTDGKVYCWGLNHAGQLGNGESGTGEESSTPVEVDAPPGVTFVSVAAGGFHTCALDADGNAYCWGENTNGQIGDGTSGAGTDRTTPVPVDAPAGVTFSALTAGDAFTCAIAVDGDTYCWGINEFGQLGNGESGAGTDRAAPFAVHAPAGVTFSGLAAGVWHACAVAADGPARCWGLNNTLQIGDALPSTDKPVPTIVAGSR